MNFKKYLDKMQPKFTPIGLSNMAAGQQHGDQHKKQQLVPMEEDHCVPDGTKDIQQISYMFEFICIFWLQSYSI
jgi:hypothetical protein